MFRLLLLLLLTLHTTDQRGELSLLLLALVLLTAGLLAFRVSCDLVRVEKVCLSVIGKTIGESSEVKKELEGRLAQKASDNTHSGWQTGSTDAFSLDGSFCTF